MTDKYDIAIAYRIYPGVSKVPPIYSDDKLKLSELCLYSFKKSLGNLKIKMFVLLDGCPDEYFNLFKKYFSEDELILIQLDGIGNAGTFKMQMDLLLEQNFSEIIYFAEDDYFYLPDGFVNMLNFFKENTEVHFASPYDHIDYYDLPIHNLFSGVTRNYSGVMWKTVASTTMTFMTNKSNLKKVYNVFLTYTKRNTDAGIWFSLTKKIMRNPLSLLIQILSNVMILKIFIKAFIFTKKQLFSGREWNLWVPVPTIATHMDDKCLAPGIDWESTFRDTSIKNNFDS